MPRPVLDLLSFPSRCLRGSRLGGWALVTAISASVMLVAVPGGRAMHPDPGGMRDGQDRSVGEAQGKVARKPGDLDPGFGKAGIVTGNPSRYWDWAHAVSMDSSHLYVVGGNHVHGERDTQWWIEKRRLADGSLAETFGDKGEVTNNPGNREDSACGIAIDSSFMYVVGTHVVSGSLRWRIEKRSLEDGALIPTFGTAGVILSNSSDSDEQEANGIAIDSSFMYVIGDLERGYDSEWRIEKRKLTDGSLDTEFGTAGVVASNPSPKNDSASCIAIDSSFLYAAGSASKPESSNLDWRIEKRSLRDGSLDAGFGTAGAVTTSPSDNDTLGEYINEIVLDSTFLYVVGTDCSQSYEDEQWRIEKRRLKDGGLEPTFGMRGVVLSNPSSREDQAWGMGVDGTFLYIVGDDKCQGPSDHRWRIERRHLGDGTLDKAFGEQGVVTGNPSPGFDIPAALVMDSSFVYVVGSDCAAGEDDAQLRIEKRCK